MYVTFKLCGIFILCILQFLVNYGIVFWSKTISMYKIFLTQKNILRNMQGINSSSCRHRFEKLEILNIPSVYIYCLMLFVVGSLHYFQTNPSVHVINTTHNTQLHAPSVTLAATQRY